MKMKIKCSMCGREQWIADEDEAPTLRHRWMGVRYAKSHLGEKTGFSDTICGQECLNALSQIRCLSYFCKDENGVWEAVPPIELFIPARGHLPGGLPVLIEKQTTEWVQTTHPNEV